MKAIITVGISASGKTTWAKEYAKANKAIISNRDDMRFALTGSTGWGDYKWDKKIESIVTNQQINLAMVASKVGKDLIVADTNLNADYRTPLVANLKDLGYEVEIKDFPITLEESWKRDSLRGNGVGRDVIYKQWQQWLKYVGRKQYVPDESLPKAIIFDIDGTLAHMNNRWPFEWDRVGEDKVDEHVLGILRFYLENQYEILLLSGRDGVCRAETVQWLHKHSVYYDALYMRYQQDTRKDAVLKEEIFWQHIAPKYNVQAVVDDRPCVIRMWNDIGIPKVICVGNQNI
jgi:predicted kinase